MPLTSVHHRRLRFYWEHGGRGNAHSDGIDLDLEGARLIERCDKSYGTFYRATEAGVQAIVAEKARIAGRRAPHDTLASRVAERLRAEGRVTWENIEFVIPGHGQAVRPDVYSLMCTKNEGRLAPTVHEVKVSRSDFLADLANPDKRGGYQKLAGRLIYVAPAGVIEPGEVPEGCGLVEERSSGQFVTVKRARSHKVDLPPVVFMNLILKRGEFRPI
ncbi:MAG: hypothetical protein HKL99_10795 [Burkholderiales bacterium]|nr:hypothetical protein [Burkholderiales bacterium]